MPDEASIFESKQALLRELGWTENPFVKDLRNYGRDSFLKYYYPLDGAKILERLAFDSKACVLVGPKGVGKTSALYYAYYMLPAQEFTPVMLKQPPASFQGVAAELGFKKRRLFEALFYSIAGIVGLKKPKEEVSRSELVEYLRSFEKKAVVFVDEAHLTHDAGIYMEFKYLLDEVPGLRIVFSALSSEGFPESLMHLVGESNVFQRKGFSREEMLEIIKHRIASAGGVGAHPFSRGALDEVLTEQNLLSPRYVFDELNKRLAEMAVGKRGITQEPSRLGGSDSLGQTAVQAAKAGERGTLAPVVTGGGRLTRVHADWWLMLSPSQQQVVQILLEHGEGLSLNEICNQTSLAQNTAFNALYQLRGEDERELERKKEVPFPLVEVQARQVGGRKKNVYYVAEKVRNLFTVS